MDQQYARSSRARTTMARGPVKAAVLAYGLGAIEGRDDLEEPAGSRRAPARVVGTSAFLALLGRSRRFGHLVARPSVRNVRHRCSTPRSTSH